MRILAPEARRNTTCRTGSYFEAVDGPKPAVRNTTGQWEIVGEKRAWPWHPMCPSTHGTAYLAFRTIA